MHLDDITDMEKEFSRLIRSPDFRLTTSIEAGKIVAISIDSRDEEEEEIPELLKQQTLYEIERIWLSNRTANALINGGIFTVKQLQLLNPGHFWKIRWFWRIATKEVITALLALDSKPNFDYKEIEKFLQSWKNYSEYTRKYRLR